jgi:hypothetical protein
MGLLTLAFAKRIVLYYCGCPKVLVFEFDRLAFQIDCAMSDSKTTPSGGDVHGFLASVEQPQRRVDSQRLLETMVEIVNEPPRMWGATIVGFGKYHYKYASGREGDSPLVGFSPRKDALTLYIMAGFDRYESLLAKLGKFKTGKGCLYLKKLADVDEAVLKELIKESAEYMRNKTWP